MGAAVCWWRNSKFTSKWNSQPRQPDSVGSYTILSVTIGLAAADTETMGTLSKIQWSVSHRPVTTIMLFQCFPGRDHSCFLSTRALETQILLQWPKDLQEVGPFCDFSMFWDFFPGTNLFIVSSFWSSHGCVIRLQLPSSLLSPISSLVKPSYGLQSLHRFQNSEIWWLGPNPWCAVSLSFSKITESILALFHLVVFYFDRFKNSSCIFNYASPHSSRPFSLWDRALSADRLSILAGYCTSSPYRWKDVVII